MNERISRFLLIVFLFTFVTVQNLHLSSIYTSIEEMTLILEEVERLQVIEDEWNAAYDLLVDTLKWHEGYRAVPYYCMAGVLTIGHGHTYKKGEHFDLPMSRETADSLLRADLNAAINYVKRTTNLEHTQLLAIGHFVYALGSGNFSKSTLKKRIIADQPIDREIVKWVHIRTKKGFVKSKYLHASRVMELNLYNLNV